MPCRIEITGIALMLHIGCTPEEQRELQPIHIRLVARNEKKFLASETDSIADTLDVFAVKQCVLRSVKGVRVQTLERLAQILEDQLREAFPQLGLQWELFIEKPKFEWSYVQTWNS